MSAFAVESYFHFPAEHTLKNVAEVRSTPNVINRVLRSFRSSLSAPPFLSIFLPIEREREKLDLFSTICDFVFPWLPVVYHSLIPETSIENSISLVQCSLSHSTFVHDERREKGLYFSSFFFFSCTFFFAFFLRKTIVYGDFFSAFSNIPQ